MKFFYKTIMKVKIMFLKYCALLFFPIYLYSAAAAPAVAVGVEIDRLRHEYEVTSAAVELGVILLDHGCLRSFNRLYTKQLLMKDVDTNNEGGQAHYDRYAAEEIRILEKLEKLQETLSKRVPRNDILKEALDRYTFLTHPYAKPSSKEFLATLKAGFEKFIQDDAMLPAKKVELSEAKLRAAIKDKKLEIERFNDHFKDYINQFEHEFF